MDEVHPEVLRRLPAGKILDFGCGRGNEVRSLLESDYDVWGADPDADELRIAQADLGERVGLMVDGRLPFDDETFDFVFSQEVFEHVADVRVAAGEIARVTKPGGGGFHVFPGRYRPIEPHLLMPAVHWLPKNRSRLLAIWLLSSLGVGNENGGPDRSERARFLWDYSVEQTFYRPYEEVANAFRRAGLIPCSVTRDHRKLQGLPLRPPESLLRALTSVNLETSKPL